MTTLIEIRVPDQPVKVIVTEHYIAEERKDVHIVTRNAKYTASAWVGKEITILELPEDDPRYPTK